MILQCPSCDARFLVADAAIPLEGRSVRCGRCKNEWHVNPNPVPMDLPPALQPKKPEPVFANFEDALAAATAEEADAMAQTLMTKPKLPVRTKPPFDPGRYALVSAVMAVALLLFVPFAYYPELKSTQPFHAIYGMLGWADSRGLEFDDVIFEKNTADGRTKYIIKGNIINRTDAKRAVGNVRVELKTKEGETIWSRTFKDPKVLTAHESYPFDIPNVETTFGGRVRTVVMDIGNDYELSLR